MQDNLKILYVHHIAEDPVNSARVAISAGHVKLVASRDIEMHGRALKQTELHFVEGDVIVFNISGLELENLESVVAGYSFG